MENVKQLHEKKSVHDIVVKGKILHFELVSKPGHLDVIYWTEVEHEIPFIGQKIKHKEVVFQECVQLKWYERAIGIKAESKVLKVINGYKKFVAQVEEADQRGEALLKKLESIQDR